MECSNARPTRWHALLFRKMLMALLIVASPTLGPARWAAATPAPAAEQEAAAGSAGTQAVSSSPLTADGLVAAIIDAHGGWERLSKIRSMHVAGSVQRQLGDRAVGKTHRYLDGPERARIDIEYPSRTELRIVSSQAVFRSGHGGRLSRASGPAADAVRLQAARLRLPWVLQERRSQAKRVSDLEIDGKKLWGVEVPIMPGLVLQAYTDPKTYYIMRTVSVLRHGTMSIRFESHYGEHRVVDGLPFAFREESFASGKHAATIVVDNVSLNPPLSPTLFEPKAASL